MYYIFHLDLLLSATEAVVYVIAVMSFNAYVLP